MVRRMNTDFGSLPLSPALLEVVQELGFTSLTPIQRESIPALLAGHDLIGQSKTGSGKTAAFTLPILQQLTLVPRALQAIVLCPTRELCTQVAREMRKLGRKHAGLQVAILSGGQPISIQRDALLSGAHIAVGTPGRVLDLLKRGDLKLAGVTMAVLDEADRMLEMGFAEDMESILGALPKKRQTVLFSATFPRTIEALSRSYQRDPVRVTIDDEASSNDIRQLAYLVTAEDKPKAVEAVLKAHAFESALLFCNHKAVVDELVQTLTKAGMSAERLHGDLEQRDRDRVMAKFRNRSIRILVATDVAARGLDVDDLDLVINVDLPVQIETYVHRIGRTGRAGKKGVAVSLFTSREQERLESIEKSTGVSIERSSLGAAKTPAASAKPAAQNADMVTLFIAGGRKDKVRPGDILGALTGEAGGFAGTDIGKIEIHDHFAYVAVAKHVAKAAVDSLSKGRIKGRRFKVGIAD
jgi:ATP-independent RNA helicase DbpA